MRLSNVTKLMAAAVVGTMLMLPMTSSAAPWLTEQKASKPQLDSAIPAIGLTATYVENYKGNIDDDGVVLHWNSVVPEEYTMYIEYSTDPNFTDEFDTSQIYFYDESSDMWYDGIGNEVNTNQEEFKDNEVLEDFSAGTYYLRTIMTTGKYDAADNYYKAYNVSPAVEVTVPAPDASYSTTVNGTSVEFKFENDVTGYEIQRKVGKKFVKVAKISDQKYTDKGLQKNTTYHYMVRTYVYNPDSQKTVYGDWTYTDVTTWGKALNLKAVPGKKATMVNLTWNKVPDASGYEIYRSVGTSSAPTKNGLSQGFADRKLIKTITKAKTKKYTDKGLIAGNDYTYYIVAYKNVAGKKVKDLTLSDSANVSLGLEFNASYSIVKDVENKDGSRTVTWKKVVGADGFKIMKYVQDPTIKDMVWSEFASLPASQISATLPASETFGASDEYRIYAFKGAELSDGYYGVSTHNYTNRNVSPNGITAELGYDAAGNPMVTVRWNQVEGAAYYKVYRSTYLPTFVDNNEDLGRYVLQGSFVSVAKQLPASAEIYEYSDYTKYSTYKITGLTVTDVYTPYVNQKEPETYCTPINMGPEPGMTYYYYVQAYRSDGKLIIPQSDYDYGYNHGGGYDEYDDPTYDANDHLQSYYGYYGSWVGEPARVVVGQEISSLKAPKLSSVKSTKKGQVKLTWKNVTGAQTYYVYCSTKKKAKNYMCVGSTTKKNFTVQGLDSKKTYYFKVKAAVGNEMSADTNMSKKFSNVKSVKVK